MNNLNDVGNTVIANNNIGNYNGTVNKLKTAAFTPDPDPPAPSDTFRFAVPGNSGYYLVPGGGYYTFTP